MAEGGTFSFPGLKTIAIDTLKCKTIEPMPGSTSTALTIPTTLSLSNLVVTGTATVPTPTLDSHAATKKYVDDSVVDYVYSRGGTTEDQHEFHLNGIVKGWDSLGADYFNIPDLTYNTDTGEFTTVNGGLFRLEAYVTISSDDVGRTGWLEWMTWNPNNNSWVEPDQSCYVELNSTLQRVKDCALVSLQNFAPGTKFSLRVVPNQAVDGFTVKRYGNLIITKLHPPW